MLSLPSKTREPGASAPNRRLPKRIAAITDDIALCDGLSRLADGDALPLPDILPISAIPDIRDEVDRRTELILLDIENAGDPAAVTASVVAGFSGRVLVVGTKNDIGLFHQLTSAGAADYHLKPLDDKGLRETLWIDDSPLGPAESDPGGDEAAKINLIIGARGGVGASTLATSIAWWVAEKLNRQVGLVDLDLSFGTTALSLDLLPGRGLRDALENAARIDPLFVGSAMVNASDNLFVLAAEEPLEEPITIEPAALVTLVDALRETFPSLIVDVPRPLVTQAGPLIEGADSVTIVSELTFAGLRDAIRVRDFAKSHATGAEVSVVATLPDNGRPALDRREFERGLEGAVDWLLPRAPKQMARVGSDGVPLVSVLGAKHPYGKAVAEMAGRCVSEPGEARRKFKLWPW